MPYQFDENKYKNIAQNMFGPKAFDFSSYYKTAQLQAQADALRDKLKDVISQKKSEMKKAKKESEKKTYQDAVDYISSHKNEFLDPDNTEWGGKTGAYQIANEIRNDPNKQAKIKAQGYNVTDFINALYAGLSGGDTRSEREYKQKVADLKKQIKNGTYNSHPETKKTTTSQPKKKKKKDENIFEKALDIVEKPFHGLMNTFNEAVKQGKINAKNHQIKQQSLSKIAKDFKQGMNKDTSGADVLKTMGIKSKTAQNIGGSTIDLFLDPINVLPFAGASKLAKVADIAAKAEKGAKALGAGNKLSKLAGISARGATVTGGASAMQQTADALAHPGEQSVGQRLANVGVNTAIGALGDVLLHGLGKGVGKITKNKLDIPKKEMAATSEPIQKPKYSTPELMQEIKDIKPWQVGTQNTYEIAARLPKAQGERIIQTLDTAKKNYVDFQEKLTNDLYNKVVKKLGIKKGTKDSALVQDFGEKTLAKNLLEKRGIDPTTIPEKELDEINLSELKRIAPDRWEKIVEADKYFRNAYDTLLYRVNQVRSKIYPNQPDKLVPRRQDYYRHFKDLTGLEGLKNLFESPANIDPNLEGISPFTKPKAKWQSFMQRRGNGKYTSDAIGGYLNYLRAASHSINIDPVIPVLRKTAKELAEATSETRNANKIIEALQDLANDFAGKTNPYDRTAQKVLGRKVMGIVNWINSHVKGNMILGNLSSALGQLGNIPLGVAKAKQYSVPGLINTLSQSAKFLIGGEKNAPIFKSQFLKERYSDAFYRKFDQKLIEQPKKFAAWLLETADKAGTNFIWNSMYAKALKQKVKDPIKFADTETRKIVAGRGVGEVPLIQKSKVFQIFAPFTLEVGNQWKVLKSLVDEKDAKGLITFLVVAYGLNKVTEQLRGSGISFDPIDAVLDGYRKTDGSELQKLGGATGSLAGEVIGNIPGGNLITNMVNTDKNIPFFNKKYADLFVDRSPNRFGSGLTFTKPFEDPLYALPFGGQARKTIQGWSAIKNKGLYKNGTLRTPIETSLLKDAQLVAFGPYAVKESRQYFERNKRPLSKQQTEIYNKLKTFKLDDDFYKKLSNLRKNHKSPTTLQKRIKEALNNGQSKDEISRIINNYPNK